MKKITTIFVRDWEGTLGPKARFVIDQPHPDCAWVFAGEGVATRKLDGTCCMVRDGKLYKRQEIRTAFESEVPDGFELVDHDALSGKAVGWVPVGDGPEDKWHREAWESVRLLVLARRVLLPLPDGTYELVGPKIQGNPENISFHYLWAHDDTALDERANPPTDYQGLRDWLAERDIEGIVWHHPDGRFAKIKKKDFGLPRKPAR